MGIDDRDKPSVPYFRVPFIASDPQRTYERLRTTADLKPDLNPDLVKKQIALVRVWLNRIQGQAHPFLQAPEDSHCLSYIGLWRTLHPRVRFPGF